MDTNTKTPIVDPTTGTPQSNVTSPVTSTTTSNISNGLQAYPSSYLGNSTSNYDIKSYLDGLTNTYNTYNKNSTDLQNQITGTLAPTAEEQAAQQRLTDLNQNERQSLQNIEQQNIPMPFITGQQASVSRQAAIDKLAASENLAALTGQRQTKFDALKAQLGFEDTRFEKLLGLQKEFGNIQKDQRDQARQTLSDIITYSQGKSFNELDQNSQDQIIKATANSPLSLNIVQQAMDRSKLAFQDEQAKNASTLNETVKLGNGSTVLINKATGKIIKYLGGATSTSDSTTLPESVVRTVATDKGTEPVTGYVIQQGEDPYTIAQQNGVDIATLQKLNPQIKDWKSIQPGEILNLPSKDDSWLKGKTEQQIQAYNSLPNSEKATIKQLVNGDALLTDIVKSRGKDTQAQINKVIAQATAIDPKFSINTNKQRFAYKQQFNNPNGKEQLQINAINTGLGHLAEFKVASDALGNKILLPYNSLVNYLKKNTGDPNVAKLNTVITALAGELASVYKGGGAPTDQETEQWRNTILSSYSKSQNTGVADTTANLISNKMLALNNSYKNIIGNYPENPIINNDVLAELADAGVDVSTITQKLGAQGYTIPDDIILSNHGVGSNNDVLGPYGL